MYGILYLPTFLVDFYGFRVGKYTVRPMDPGGVGIGPRRSFSSEKSSTRNPATPPRNSRGPL